MRQCFMANFEHGSILLPPVQLQTQLHVLWCLFPYVYEQNHLQVNLECSSSRLSTLFEIHGIYKVYSFESFKWYAITRISWQQLCLRRAVHMHRRQIDVSMCMQYLYWYSHNRCWSCRSHYCFHDGIARIDQSCCGTTSTGSFPRGSECVAKEWRVGRIRRLFVSWLW